MADEIEQVPVLETMKVAAVNTSGLETLQESREEMINRVQNLKKDLQDWRGKLDNQVKKYRQELTELRNSLNTEVEQLRTEFQDLRANLRKQLEMTVVLAPSDAPEDPLAPKEEPTA